MKANRISTALFIALAGTVALAGCKKKEEAVVAPPVVTEPAPMVAPAPAVSATSVTVGNAAAADKSVASVSTFGPRDVIIVSIRTDASSATNAAIDAKLTYQDGQVAAQQTATVVAADAGITNVTFSNANPWPTGTYTVDTTLNGQAAGMSQQIEVK